MRKYMTDVVYYKKKAYIFFLEYMEVFINLPEYMPLNIRYTLSKINHTRRMHVFCLLIKNKINVKSNKE